MSFKTEQEEFWAGEFGDTYISRNSGRELLASNLNFFSGILKKAVRLIGEYDFSMSVALYPYPIQRALFVEGQSNTIQMLEKKNLMKRSQDLTDSYHDAGQFIVGKTNSWLKKKPIVEGKTLPITVPRLRVQDIDDEEDWNEAELKFSLIKDEFEERNLT